MRTIPVFGSLNGLHPEVAMNPMLLALVRHSARGFFAGLASIGTAHAVGRDRPFRQSANFPGWLYARERTYRDMSNSQ